MNESLAPIASSANEHFVDELGKPLTLKRLMVAVPRTHVLGRVLSAHWERPTSRRYGQKIDNFEVCPTAQKTVYEYMSVHRT